MLYKSDSDGYTLSAPGHGSADHSRALVPVDIPVIYVGDDAHTAYESCAPRRGPLHAAARLLHAIADQVDELRHRLEQQTDSRY